MDKNKGEHVMLVLDVTADRFAESTYLHLRRYDHEEPRLAHCVTQYDGVLNNFTDL